MVESVISSYSILWFTSQMRIARIAIDLINQFANKQNIEEIVFILDAIPGAFVAKLFKNSADCISLQGFRDF